MTADLPTEALAVLDSDPLLREWAELRRSGLFTFTPRPDNPAEFDEQESFVRNRDRVAFCIGGNASGTTTAAAFKTAVFLLQQQPPPRHDTPFWVLGPTYDQVTDVFWKEKLLGNGFIPRGEIDWNRVAWHSAANEQPAAVPLRPWPANRGGDAAGKNNWRIEFKSYDQGRDALQAKSIGGFCFSEQFPLDLFLETLRGCRDYMFPGGQFCEFTPIDPELCLWVEKLIENIHLHEGWKIYRCNTQLNRQNLAAGWFEDFFGAVPDEMLQTRMTGALAGFEGVIYPTFQPRIHVLKGPLAIPPGVQHYRGIDWGASREHPFVCLWGYRDGMGDWTIYDEYWSPSQTATAHDHADEIVERSLDWGWPAPQGRMQPGYWLKDGDNGNGNGRHGNGGNGSNGNGHAEPLLLPPSDADGRGDPHYGWTYCDPSRPDQMNLFTTEGIWVWPAVNDVYAGINTVRSLLKVVAATGLPKLRIHERCVHTIEEIRKYRWMKGRKAGTVLNPTVGRPVPLKMQDDCPDALRYLVHTAEMGRGAAPASMSYREWCRRQSVQLVRDIRPESAGRVPYANGWFRK